jgi:GDP-4-dehydro-6-deoxy-D-mannose reductase
VRPNAPYGASKAAAEVLASASAARTGLPVTIARLFNQLGPDQPPAQVPAGFAVEIAAAESAGAEAVALEIGNPDAERDYTDVRDTARALLLTVERRATGTFNFCSGRTRSLRQVIEALAELTEVAVKIETAPERTNRNDVSVFAGSADKLRSATGWTPEISLEQSLAALLEARRVVLSDAG